MQKTHPLGVPLAAILVVLLGSPARVLFPPASATPSLKVARAQPVPPLASPLVETTHSRVAAHFAPTIFQETRDARDLLTSFDFDGDWDGSNNAVHVATYPLRAVLYYTVVETATHYLITYMTYHPVDAKWGSGHDHDSEHITLVVRKDRSRVPAAQGSGFLGFGRLEAMETRFHKVLYQYAAPSVHIGSGADNVDGLIHLGDDGRPEVYAQRVGHGLCGGDAPFAFIDSFALSCSHGSPPRIHQKGVIYRYRGVAGVPRSLDDRDVGYALVEIGDTLWRHVRDHGPHAVFASLMNFEGERCGQFDCPRGIGRELNSRPGRMSTGMPWDEGGGRGVSRSGDAFFDPAWTLSRRLRFPAPFSTDYLHNPYLGVGHFAGEHPSAEPVIAKIGDEAAPLTTDLPRPPLAP